jgi:Mn2+/Fe2+ NRAMP family transporter
MANIGTTITPWQIFFQQSSVVDKGMDVHDVAYGKIDTFAGSFLTGAVAVFIIICTGAAFYYHNPPILVEDATQTANALVPLLPGSQGHWARLLFAIGLFDAGFLGALCISLSTSWAVGEVLRCVPADSGDGRRGGAHPRRSAHHYYDVCAGGRRYTLARGFAVSYSPPE